jgi:hypothetical protein
MVENEGESEGGCGYLIVILGMVVALITVLILINK